MSTESSPEAFEPHYIRIYGREWQLGSAPPDLLAEILVRLGSAAVCVNDGRA